MINEVSTTWAARRALLEGAPVTVELLARAGGVSVATVERRAAREGWRLATRGNQKRADRIARIHDRLLEKVERAQLQADDENVLLDKAGIAELSATVRTLAKISETMRDDDGAREQQLVRDADIAGIVDRLDAKIIELAGHLAAQMAGGNVLGERAGAGEP